MRSYRGTSVNTDHHLLIAKTKIRIVRDSRSKTINKKWNVENLNNEENKRKYQEEVQAKLKEKERNHNIEDEWENIKATIIEASEETIKRNKTKNRTNWFDNECDIIIKKKREARLRWIRSSKLEDYELYKQIRKEATKLIKEKKLKWINTRMDELEKDNNNNRRLYRQIKQQKRKKATTRINKGQWQEYLENLTNTEDNSEEEQKDNNQEEFIQEPTVEEVYNIINDLKNGKAPGSDSINNEMIKNGGEELSKRMFELILKIWRNETMPEEWRLGIIIPIPKTAILENVTTTEI